MLRRRPHNEIDRWDGHVYRRALPFEDRVLALAATQSGSPEDPRLEVSVEGVAIDGRAEAAASAGLRRLLGTEVDVSGFAAAAARDPRLDGLATRMRGLKPPRFPTVFEGLVNGIACQQHSLDVGIHLLDRITAAHGPSAGGDPDGLHAFPGPSELAAVDPAELRRLGFSLAKAPTIVDSASAIVDGALDLEALEDAEDAEVRGRLTSIRGVGRWTAEYVMLRGLGRLHIFPGDDVGARNKLKGFLGVDQELDYEGVARAVSGWQPYAGFVYFHPLLDSLSRAGLVA